jgi:hypothetical protein
MSTDKSRFLMRHFDKVATDSGVVKCKHCPTSPKAKIMKKNNSSLAYHLEHEHGLTVASEADWQEDAPPTRMRRITDYARKLPLTPQERVALAFAINGIPYRSIEDEFFRAAFCTSLQGCSKLGLPARPSVVVFDSARLGAQMGVNTLRPIIRRTDWTMFAWSWTRDSEEESQCGNELAQKTTAKSSFLFQATVVIHKQLHLNVFIRQSSRQLVHDTSRVRKEPLACCARRGACQVRLRKGGQKR